MTSSSSPSFLLPIAFLIIGLLVGSFLCVVIYRVPLGRSIVRPGSACPRCDTAITKIDNIPVLSWLILGGKCRHCGATIPVRYPLVEAATGLGFGATAWFIAATVSNGPIVWTVFACTVLAFGIAIAVIDVDVRRIPNTLILPLLGVIVVGLPTSAAIAGIPVDQWPIGRALLSAAAWAGADVLLWAGPAILLGKPGMDFGDVKLALTLGLLTGWVGWPASILGFGLAFVIAALIAVPLLLTKRASPGQQVPHAPHMLIGATIGIVAGADLAHWYLVVLTR